MPARTRQRPSRAQPESGATGISYFNSFSTTSIKPFSGVAKIPTLLLNIDDAMAPGFFLMKEKTRETVPPDLPKIFADPLSMRRVSPPPPARRGPNLVANAAAARSPSAVRGASAVRGVPPIRGPPPTVRGVPPPNEDFSDLQAPAYRRPKWNARPIRPGETPPPLSPPPPPSRRF